MPLLITKTRHEMILKASHSSISKQMYGTGVLEWEAQKISLHKVLMCQVENGCQSTVHHYRTKRFEWHRKKNDDDTDIEECINGHDVFRGTLVNDSHAHQVFPKQTES